jgi:hypothetical protein
MMGTKARLFMPIAAVLLEDLVPATHFYRHLDRVLDLSFVRELVKTTLTRFKGVSERGMKHKASFSSDEVLTAFFNRLV